MSYAAFLVPLGDEESRLVVSRRRETTSTRPPLRPRKGVAEGCRSSTPPRPAIRSGPPCRGSAISVLRQVADRCLSMRDASPSHRLLPSVCSPAWRRWSGRPDKTALSHPDECQAKLVEVPPPDDEVTVREDPAAWFAARLCEKTFLRKRESDGCEDQIEGFRAGGTKINSVTWSPNRCRTRRAPPRRTRAPCSSRRGVERRPEWRRRQWTPRGCLPSARPGTRRCCPHAC